MSKNSEHKEKRVYFIESASDSVWVKHLKIQDGQMIHASPWKKQ